MSNFWPAYLQLGIFRANIFLFSYFYTYIGINKIVRKQYALLFFFQFCSRYVCRYMFTHAIPTRQCPWMHTSNLVLSNEHLVPSLTLPLERTTGPLMQSKEPQPETNQSGYEP